jgi:SSS family solute:Na+ symporter
MIAARILKHVLRAALFASVSCGALLAMPVAANAAEVNEQLYDSAVQELQRALEQEPRWVKIHAGESLLSLGLDDHVEEIFDEELKQYGNEPQYRIGIWRVLFRAAANPEQRSRYLNQIRNTYLDKSAPDRSDAAESLAKLGYAILTEDRRQFEELGRDASDAGAPFRRWILAVSGDQQDVRYLADLLDSSDAEIRANTAYALKHLADKLPPEIVKKLASKAAAEPPSKHRVYLISAAYVTARDAAQKSWFKKQLKHYTNNSASDEKYEAATALATRGTSDDLQELTALLHDSDPDVRVAAAHAILRIDRRRPLPFEALDWIVLAGYGAGMLAIGWYFARRNANSDEYLLAGRNMKPWAVGLSYFATLFSTITYLAYPGEVIRYGPVILGSVLAYPFVYLVVSRWLIPSIMSLNVTSAYELLEKRFGLSVRLLGATFFLMLRLVWMSVIIFATAQSVLVPLIRLPESATPWVCLVMGMLTVTYTSVGGLPAVIWTDVAQTFILFAGAIISIVLISFKMGGVSAWWPHEWPYQWGPVTVGFDPGARITIASAMALQFVWYICTAGSDQMAVQRYLATRDAASARKMFGISLTADALVSILLAALGLALFGFFHANPRLLPDGETLLNSADMLLPQFIVKVLPAGLSGMVVAGLLAAAMSSLSSGVSASSSVVMVDWINRFKLIESQNRDPVRLARRVSWFVGLTVVFLSYLATFVSGNLLEVTNKLCNLLTAPLFVLFFMAMFVPWATAFGTWTGASASVCAAVAIAYFEFMGLSFTWIMPVSLLTGIVAGCTVSLFPIGASRPMLKLSE